MTRFGYFASLEEYSPATCLEQVCLAEEAGFDSVWVNDHFPSRISLAPDTSSLMGKK